ncbi:MAG: glycosyltransferase [Bacteroidia bacterium]|nr:glycosyltransferase [Bacteroidia bacterium]
MEALVTIIIPVYNYGQFLAAAIDTVIAQSYRSIEVIVVDDGSTDNTAKIAQSYSEVQYFYQKNQGVAVARNTGISKARGKFIGFLDADDTWSVNKLKIQIRNLIENPGLGFNMCKNRNFIESGVKLDPKITGPFLERVQICFASLVTHRNLFDQIGGYDPHYKILEDLDWLIRAKDAGIIMEVLPDILVNRRIHTHNLSLTNQQAWQKFKFQILKESIERQRKKEAGIKSRNRSELKIGYF